MFQLQIGQSWSWPLDACDFPGTHFFPKFQVGPLSDDIPPSFLLSSSFPAFLYSALQDGLCKAWWSGDVSIPSQLLLLNGAEHVIMRTDGLTGHLLNFLICDILGVRDAQESSVASHLYCLYPSLQLSCEWGSMFHRHIGRLRWIVNIGISLSIPDVVWNPPSPSVFKAGDSVKSLSFDFSVFKQVNPSKSTGRTIWKASSMVWFCVEDGT